jgi:DNA polymerase-3 subunit delta
MDHCTIIVLAAKADRRSAMVKVAQATHGFFDWEKLAPADVASWAKRMATECGKALPEDAATFLAQQLGTDLERIRSEIEKASLYSGTETNRLTIEDIQAVMVAVKTESVFDLTDAVGEKNRAKAFYFLDGMLATGSVPIRVHATIYRHIRKLLAVKELSEKGWDADRIAKEIGAHPYAVGKMKTQAGRYRLSDLRLALPILSRTDFDLKNSRADHRVVLEKMILDLCRSGA